MVCYVNFQVMYGLLNYVALQIFGLFLGAGSLLQCGRGY